MIYHSFFVIFEKAAKFESRLLQMIGGSLWVNLSAVYIQMHKQSDLDPYSWFLFV